MKVKSRGHGTRDQTSETDRIRTIGKYFHTTVQSANHALVASERLACGPREIGDHRAEDLNVHRLREETIESESKDSRALTGTVRPGQPENPARPPVLVGARARLTQQPDAIVRDAAWIADDHGRRRRVQQGDGFARATHRPDVGAVHREQRGEDRAVFAIGFDQDNANAAENFVGKPLLVHAPCGRRLQWMRHAPGTRSR